MKINFKYANLIIYFSTKSLTGPIGLTGDKGDAGKYLSLNCVRQSLENHKFIKEMLSNQG